jgi:uncharacterized membrane protein YeaQ/YmgE (transglycosylase-associated protein family)
MVNVFFWVAFGSVVGWTAAILQDETTPLRISGYLIAGALGGLGGGIAGLWLSPGALDSRSTSSDITFALFGAAAAVAITGRAVQKRSRE